MGRIRVGVAGWEYPDWNGIVYPAGDGAATDRLAWIARFVDVVEINSTFYRPVAARTAESWVRRTGYLPDFTFTAKVHRSWTHQRDEPLIRETLVGLEPLREAGRLSGLLLQFPQSFHYGPEAMDYLARLSDSASGYPLVLEVRHSSWDHPGLEEALAGAGIGWCAVDQPQTGPPLLPPIPIVTTPRAYFRLHGRNTADWFREGAGRDARYDYLYGGDEVGGLADTAISMADKAEELILIQNNHFRGKALANAIQMKHRLTGERPPAPATLVDEYPGLAGICSIIRSRLF
jgi:uncharacterized protein YecE (DUF72 family)